MSYISMKPHNNILLPVAALSILIAGLGIPFGYAQTNWEASWQALQNRAVEPERKSGVSFGYDKTNLQESQNRVVELESRVVELERKLADAKARQEKAYNVQMKLEEQEQALAGLANSDKYRVQIVEIRSDIKNVRTRIEAIIKEKNDLEENLRLAKNLQSILREAQQTAKPNIKIPPLDQEKASNGQQNLNEPAPTTKKEEYKISNVPENPITWEYQTYNSEWGKPEKSNLGYITLNESSGKPLLRIVGVIRWTWDWRCYTQDLDATITKAENTTIITAVPSLRGCEEFRFVLKNDGTGGRREIKKGSEWVWDGLERGLTRRK